MYYRGVLAQSGEGKVTYKGGLRKYTMVKEGMGVEKLIGMVKEITRTDMSEKRLCYSLKKMLLAVEGDTNVKMMFKGNDEHGYLYVGGNKGPLRRAQEGFAVCEGRVRGCPDRKVCSRSGRNGHDGVTVGREGDHKQAGGKRQGGKNDLCHEQWLLGGEGDDDEISVASDDAGDKDTIEQDNAGDKQSPQTSCDQGTKSKGCGDGEDDIVKRKNGVADRIEQKLAGTYQKMGCIVTVECYSMMLGEYSVELTNSCKLVYDYVHPIYKSATREVICNQLVHPMETHDMGKVNEKTGVVVGGEELDDDYNRCIPPPNNGRHPGVRPFFSDAGTLADTSLLWQQHLQMYLHHEHGCICSNLCGTKNTFVEYQKMHTPPTKPMGPVKSWLLAALRSISPALSSPTLISVTTITGALVTANSPQRLDRKDVRVIPLQFQMAIRMSLRQ
ncbi:LOW QUALITY PROTEIN: hypothetical protein Cgig2_002721 [Carnegiea gigantea]|uniref:Uncharacterized protein n=1 Tax=Carnegiea gigantea TaxID=171969 RepID=A0A9Q1Q6N6_9CARY|nr:LOW QUALITY PROTEIN: hypothetical protein Cgig2_002721 [Carnegiea gigantea]